MSNEPKGQEQQPQHSPEDLPPETAAGQKGGVEAAKQQAERDWQDSAKEDGE